MERRSIVKAIIYSFITCGIYGVWWFIKITDETHYAVGRQTTASGFTAFLYSIVTCGLYLFYWTYVMSESLNEAKAARGMHVDGNASILYLLLMVCGLGIISEALLQNSLNEIFDFDSDSYDLPSNDVF